MSNEGRYGQKEFTGWANILSTKLVLRRQGSTPEFIKRYRMLAASAAAQKLPGLRKLAPDLLTLISDERTLFSAWTHMATHGGTAPGPDGCRYEQFTPSEVWDWCRLTRDEIRAGSYELDDEFVHRIPKQGGRGYRELVLQSIFDRTVARAAVEILQPLIDPLFSRRSFGYRPRRGPLRALASAEKLYQGGKRGVWVSADIRNAFPSVPIGRLLDVLRAYLPDEKLLAFLAVLTKEGKRSGLRQGSPFAPLLLNLYLHHLLDRKWQESFPKLPLLRFADDLLVLCRSPNKASDAYAALAKLIRDAGLEVKETADEAIKSLADGQTLKWMGYGIRGDASGLAYTITDDAWDGLNEQLTAAHAKPNSPIAALRTIVGWIADKGPCYPHTDLDQACTRISSLAAEQGFSETPEHHALKAVWQRAHARWCKLRKQVTGN